MSKRRRHHPPPEPEPAPVVEPEPVEDGGFTPAEQRQVDEGILRETKRLEGLLAESAVRLAAAVARENAQQRDKALEIVARRHDVIPAAVEDFVRRAAETWKLDSGQLVAVDAGGIPVFSREMPAQLMTPDEYARRLKETDAPYLFTEKRRSK